MEAQYTPFSNDLHDPVRILVAEDDEEMRNLLVLVLAQDGYEVDVAVDGYQLLETMARLYEEGDETRYGLIIADLRMPGYNGLDVLAASLRLRERVPVIVLSAYLDEANRRQAFYLGASAVLEKPVDLDDCRMTVLSVLREARGSGLRGGDVGAGFPR